MNLWADAFSFYGIKVAQGLTTYANWEQKTEKQNIKTGILSFLRNRVVPIINENDFIADEEIKSMEQGISENDQLAQMIASLIKAKLVLFLTDEGGIFDKNPKTNSEAKRYKEFTQQDIKKLSDAEKTNKNGKGGMSKKIKFAIMCAEQGIFTCIASGKESDVITKFGKRKTVGTKIEIRKEKIRKIGVR